MLSVIAESILAIIGVAMVGLLTFPSQAYTSRGEENSPKVTRPKTNENRKKALPKTILYAGSKVGGLSKARAIPGRKVLPNREYLV